MENKELIDRYKKSQYLTVGKLKEILYKYPNDALVVSQRVEDVYFEKHNWNTIKKPDHLYPEENNEYSPVWSVVNYKDDENCLYLDLHY